MKIGIITLAGYYNYGNRLQNYAVYEILGEYGCDAVNFEFTSQNIGKNFCKAVLGWILTDQAIGVIPLFHNKKFLDLKKEKELKKFTKKFIPKENMEKKESMDFFVTGSDQVWNPYFAGGEEYYLRFVPPEKRVAFIASIGVTELPEQVRENVKNWLAEMRYISVREESSVALIHKLTGRKVDCFLDPTLLLNKTNWEKLSRQGKMKVPEHYILSFFFGKEPEEVIRYYSEKLACDVIRLENVSYPKYYAIAPEKFLYLISQAELVLTDSFHGTAFSIKFRKQFYVFERKQEGFDNMFTRIESLLTRFHLEQRFHARVMEEQSFKEKTETEKISESEFLEIETELVKERQEFDKKMKQALGIEMRQEDNRI